MSGDVTIQALSRLSWLPDRDAGDNGLLIAGQRYDDVYFVGGTMSNIVLDSPTINNPVISGGTFTTLTVGTLTLTNPLVGQYGGTGVNNTGKTITLGGNLVTSGAFATTLTVTGITNVTLPTTGTLATRAGVETFTNKTLTSPVITTPTISSIVNTGTLTLPTSTDTLVGRATTDTLTNKTINGSNNTITNVSLSTGVTGTLGATTGGTGQTTVTTGDILYGSAANTWSKLAGVATGNALISGGVGVAPSWGKIALTTHVSGVLPVASGGLNLSTYTTGDIIYASGANTPAKLAIGSTNQFLSVVAGVPAWVTGQTPWVAYTPTFNAAFGTVSGVSFFSRRNGKMLEIRGNFTVGTTTAATGQITYGFNGTNNGVTLDNTAMPSGNTIVGMCAMGNTGQAPTVLADASTTYFTFGYAPTITPTNISGIFGSAVAVSVFLSVPISGW